MKLYKKLFIILLSCCHTLTYAEDFLNKLKTLEHENPGCPFNSICSKPSGKLLQNWEKMLGKIDDKNKLKQLKAFKKAHGIPLEFLTTKDARIPIDPIMFNSRCKLHNPKNPHNNIYKGIKFLKKIVKSEHMHFPTVVVYDGKKKTHYKIPYQDQVLFIQNEQLIILKDYDDTFYQIGVATDGNFYFKNFPHSLITQALEKKVKEIKCPDKIDYDERYFSTTYCQKVLDLESNKLKMIQYTFTCP